MALDRVLDDADEAFEGRVARDVARVLPDGATLVVARLGRLNQSIGSAVDSAGT